MDGRRGISNVHTPPPINTYPTPPHASIDINIKPLTTNPTKQAVMWLRAFSHPEWANTFDYFINLSAADIPIVPIEHIEARFVPFIVDYLCIILMYIVDPCVCAHAIHPPHRTCTHSRLAHTHIQTHEHTLQNNKHTHSILFHIQS